MALVCSTTRAIPGKLSLPARNASTAISLAALRIVGAENLKEAAITTDALVGSDDAEDRAVPGTFLTETDNDGHDTGWKKGGDSSGGGQWRLSEETQPLFPTPKVQPS
jgi:hypothetical protein